MLGMNVNTTSGYHTIGAEVDWNSRVPYFNSWLNLVSTNRAYNVPNS